MPTKRTRRARFRNQDVSPEYWSFLTDAPFPEDGNPFAEFGFDKEAKGLWEKYRDQILADWIDVSPGTRPSHWWKFDAPRASDTGRYKGAYFEQTLIEPRKLLRGEGVPAWEGSFKALMPNYHLGIPTGWSGGDPELLEFESQHDYLKRHGLLTPGEGESTERQFFPTSWDLGNKREPNSANLEN